ncbi:EAL domain-containing protein [Rhizobacter sp. Root1221]|uniref:sensor domain-containing protein n=1 Tax=Rhizobacter sp. Root1221 TaxID=1736433 RepID=UPI000A9AA000|nr:EAL domain-containing protein [Rhizobacter sp. Root1221]
MPQPPLFSLSPPTPPDPSVAGAMLDALPGRVCLIDGDGLLRHTNRAWRAAAGVSWGVEGSRFADHCPDPALAARLQALMLAPQGNVSTCISPMPGVRVMARASRFRHGDIDGVLLILDDVDALDTGDEALARFRAAMETTSDAIYLVDRATMRFIDVNDAACRLRQCTRAELMAMGPARALLTDRSGLEAVYDGVIAAGEAVEPVEWTHGRDDGERVYAEIRRRALRTTDGWVIVTISRDITARKNAENGVRRAARQQGLIAGFGQTALATPRIDTLFQRAAAVAAEGLHIEFAEVSQRLPDGGALVLAASAGFDDGYVGHPMAGEGRLTQSAQVMRANAPVVVTDHPGELPGACALLQRHHVRSGMGVPIPGPLGPRGVLGVYSPRAWRFNGDSVHFLESVANTLATAIDRIEAESRLVQLSQFDMLTGLPNRGLVLDRLSQALAHAQRHDWRVDVMFLNLDRFKMVNDTLGHAMGDALLAQAAQRLKACARASDTVGRLGGDEFAIVLPKPDDAATVAKRVMAALAEPFELAGQAVHVSASIGIGVFPNDGHDADTLLKNAGTAMNQAKQRGRNHHVFYLPQMNDQAGERLRLENQLRYALERNEFLLHYQPKVNVASGEITGFEALLRWQHPERGMVPPLEFIATLEDTGMIVPVGEWVLRTVCRQLARWKADGLALKPVAINLSARQFQDKGLDEVVRTIVAEEGGDPSMLEFELTESMLMADADAAARTLSALKTYGIRLSVDDFGTGYSSLSYLKRFPLDALKIDRSFMRDVTTDHNDASIALAIIRLAHSLRLDVVAEGVETADQLQFLRSHDCDQMQGYFFSKPLPVADCTRVLSEDRRLQGASALAA